MIEEKCYEIIERLLGNYFEMHQKVSDDYAGTNHSLRSLETCYLELEEQHENKKKE